MSSEVHNLVLKADSGSIRRATQDLDKLTNAANDTEASATSVGRNLSGGFGKAAIAATAFVAAAGAVYAATKAIVTEAIEAEREQAQLAAVLTSTGGAAGYAQSTLNDMADTLAKSAGLTAGEVTRAQTALLAFTNITGEQFPAAMQAAADMAARTGMSIQQTTELIGRSLDVPSQGMAALSKQGFRFSDAQKVVVKQLEETGKTAEAQAIILDSLTSTYGGAASAARNTLGGAISALKSTIVDSMGVSTTQFEGATKSLNELNDTLMDPNVQSGIKLLTSSLASLGNEVVRLGVGFLEAAAQAPAFFQWLIGKTDLSNMSQVHLRLGDIEADIAELNKKREEGVSLTAMEWQTMGALMKEQKELNKAVQAYNDKIKEKKAEQEAAKKAADEKAKADAAAAKVEAERVKREEEKKRTLEEAARLDEQRKKAILERAEALKFEAETLRMTAEQAELYKLRMMGADDQIMMQIRAYMKEILEYKKITAEIDADFEGAMGKGSADPGGLTAMTTEFGEPSGGKTGTELEQERYEKKRERMKEYNELFLTDDMERKRLELELEAEHQANLLSLQEKGQLDMKALQEMSWESRFKLANSTLNDLISLSGTSNEKMLKAQRIVGASSALISTLQGQATALVGPFPGNLVAAATVGAAGMGFVNAIKSGSKASSRVSASTPSTAGTLQAEQQAPPPRQQVDFQFSTNGRSIFRDEEVKSMMEQIAERLKDGDVSMGGVAFV